MEIGVVGDTERSSKVRRGGFLGLFGSLILRLLIPREVQLFLAFPKKIIIVIWMV